MGSGAQPPPVPRPPKRQIIKVRSQRPYIVARVVLVAVVLAALAAIVIAVSSHRGLMHRATGISPVTTVVAPGAMDRDARLAARRRVQEPRIPTRMATIRQWSYRRS